MNFVGSRMEFYVCKKDVKNGVNGVKYAKNEKKLSI